MKKLFDSLPFRLLLGIAVGILCGLVFPESVMKVVLLLIKNNRVNLIRTMALSFGDIYRKANSIARVVITTAADIDEKELSKIKNIVQKHVADKTIELSHVVTP